MSDVSLYNCWTCNRRLEPGEVSEEYFFWCNKECYDKDDRYHNRKFNREEITGSKPETTTTTPQSAKEQRRAKIRTVLAQINRKDENKS